MLGTHIVSRYIDDTVFFAVREPNRMKNVLFESLAPLTCLIFDDFSFFFFATSQVKIHETLVFLNTFVSLDLGEIQELVDVQS